MKKGILITFEGGEGSGKTTQYKLFRDYLKEIDPMFFGRPVREPGGTVIGERIRAILLDPSIDSMSIRAETLLFEAARAQIVDEILGPAIENGRTVVLDRYFDSTTAYQGSARGIGVEKTRLLNHFATNGLAPDLTFLLDIDPLVGLERATREATDRLEAESIEFHNAVREGYLEAARLDPERVYVIDATASIEDIFNQITERYSQYLEGR